MTVGISPVSATVSAAPASTAGPAAARPGTGLILVAAAGLLWGTGGLTGSLLGRAAGLPALSVAGYRLAAGGVLIVAFLTVTGRRWPAGRAAWARIAVIGLLAAVFQSCYFLAVSLTSVSLAVTAAAGVAALTLLGSRPVAGLSELAATGFGFTVGGLVLLPLAVAAGGIAFRVGPASLGLLALLGTGPTAVAYPLYFRGLRTAPASRAALLALLEPLTGTVLAWLVLGQGLTATGIAGALVLGAALVLAATAR